MPLPVEIAPKLGASGRRWHRDLQVAAEPLSLDLSAIRFQIGSFWERNLEVVQLGQEVLVCPTVW
jgi:hypothetical protein